MDQQEIHKEIELMKERNRRVEIDKAWETSWTRRLFIAAITYIFAGLWLITIHDSNPWLKALVPMAGFLISTFTLPTIKLWWAKFK